MNDSDTISSNLLFSTYIRNLTAIDYYLNRLLAIVNNENNLKDDLIITKQNLIKTKKIIQNYNIGENRIIKVNAIISQIDLGNNIHDYNIFNANWRYDY